MNIQIDVTNSHNYAEIPSEKDFTIWALAALHDQFDQVDLSICLVNLEESADFNQRYRHKEGPTNVLSFPFEVPEGFELDTHSLGDLIICVPLMAREAREQNKDLHFHWAHLVIHGVLHLQGFDHVEEDEAVAMELTETKILQSLNFPNPYEQDET